MPAWLQAGLWARPHHAGFGAVPPGESRQGFSCGSSRWSTRPFWDLRNKSSVFSFHLCLHFP